MLKAKLVVGFVVLGLVGCSEQNEEKKGFETQVAAIVNGEEITVHQVNDAIRQNRIKTNNDVDQKVVANQLLDKLVDQSVVYQAAINQGLDRDPEVVSAIEMAKVQVLNKAYLSKRLPKNISIPESEIKQYFEENQYIFAQRKIFDYTLLRIKATTEEKELFTKKLESLSNFDVFKNMLDETGVDYKQSRELAFSEKIIKSLLELMYTLNVNDVGLLTLSDGLLVVQLNDRVDKSVSMKDAKPIIEKILQNKKQQETLKNIVKHLKSSAEVNYKGDYSAPETSEEQGDSEISETPVIN